VSRQKKIFLALFLGLITSIVISSLLSSVNTKSIQRSDHCEIVTVRSAGIPFRSRSTNSTAHTTLSSVFWGTGRCETDVVYQTKHASIGILDQQFHILQTIWSDPYYNGIYLKTWQFYADWLVWAGFWGGLIYLISKYANTNAKVSNV
jgi:hypothetical protein